MKHVPQKVHAPSAPDFAASLPEEFLECRDMGHMWRPYTARFEAGKRWYHRAMKCSRCKTERRQVLDERGGILASGYYYPDGYQSEGLGRLTGDDRGTLRLESVGRWIADHEEVEVRRGA